MPSNNKPTIYRDTISILKLLQRIQKQRSLLHITLENHEKPFSSYLLKLGTAGMMLDQLNPKTVVDIQAGDHFTITTQFNGVEVNFKTKITRTGHQDGDDYYISDIPSQLTHHQLRTLFRADIPRASHYSVRLIRESHEEIAGELHDISNGGISIREVKQGKTPFYENEVIPECIIDIGEENKVYCAIELRRTPAEEQLSDFILGGQFLEIDPIQQRMIERFVTHIERERRRTLARD